MTLPDGFNNANDNPISYPAHRFNPKHVDMTLPDTSISPTTMVGDLYSKLGDVGWKFLYWIQPPGAHSMSSKRRKLKGRRLSMPTTDESKYLYPSDFNKFALFVFRGDTAGTNGDSQTTRDVAAMTSTLGLDGTDTYLSNYANYLGKGGPNSTLNTINEIYAQNKWDHLKYSESDFIMNREYGFVPFNNLITLRRFVIPVGDNIFDYGRGGFEDVPPKANKGVVSGSVMSYMPDTPPALVTMTTYFGKGTNNPMESILKFSFGPKWKEATGEVRETKSNDEGYTAQGIFSGGIGSSLKVTQAGGLGDRLNKSMLHLARGNSSAQAAIADKRVDPLEGFQMRYKDYVWGDVDVVNQTNIRDRGLESAQEIVLSFNYSLKSLRGRSPRVVFMDLLANVIAMGTNTGKWFGGCQLWFGSNTRMGAKFGDLNLLRQGDMTGYAKSMVQDLKTSVKGWGEKNKINLGEGADLKSLLKAGIALVKDMLGGYLMEILKDEAGLHQAQAALYPISGEPTGFWHLTVGNPLSPIATIGNLYLDGTGTEITFSDETYYDGFPTGMTVKLSLKQGKPRDSVFLQNMFNMGRGPMFIEFSEESYKSFADDKDEVGSYENPLTELAQDPKYSVFDNLVAKETGGDSLVGNSKALDIKRRSIVTYSQIF